MSWRRTLLLAVILLALLPVFSFRPARGVRAASAEPLFNAQTCDSTIGGGCSGDTEWTGLSQHGGETTVTVDNPNGIYQVSYNKSITVTTSNFVEAVVGIIKDQSVCGGALEYYIQVGSSGIICKGAVPSGDVNHSVTFQLSYYASHGGGVFLWIINTATGDKPCDPCPISNSSFLNPIVSVDLGLFESTTNLTSHQIWGGDWIQNGYWSGTAWAFFTSGPTPTQTNNFGSGAPPQMYWQQVPAPGNSGGALYSCVYNNATNSCTIGSSEGEKA